MTQKDEKTVVTRLSSVKWTMTLGCPDCGASVSIKKGQKEAECPRCKRTWAVSDEPKLFRLGAK